MQALQQGGLEVALPALLSAADNGLAPATFANSTDHSTAGHYRKALLTKKTSSGHACSRGALATTSSALLEALTRFHQEQRHESGPDRSRLRRYGLPHLELAYSAPC